MKLAGPEPRVRFILVPREMLAIVGGIFPPERAPAIRAVAEEEAARLYPIAMRSWRAANDQYNHELIYGRPGARMPVGILHGKSVIQTALARAP